VFTPGRYVAYNYFDSNVIELIYEIDPKLFISFERAAQLLAKAEAKQKLKVQPQMKVRYQVLHSISS
jgi:hypothetical protein